ncbi:type VI secretion system tube protein TssD [Apibacter sp. B2912]|uniref:type VI secretion system tube protein TssD n=1 Tax=Apibacter sp. B2912 TaxID=2656763 RepID=UPI00351B32F0
MLSTDGDKIRKIIFFSRDGMSRLLEKTFEKVYCIKFRDKFSSVGTSPIQVSMTLLALSLSFNGFLSLKRNRCLVKFFYHTT